MQQQGSAKPCTAAQTVGPPSHVPRCYSVYTPRLPARDAQRTLSLWSSTLAHIVPNVFLDSRLDICPDEPVGLAGYSTNCDRRALWRWERHAYCDAHEGVP